MRISDWSSDVCSSDLREQLVREHMHEQFSAWLDPARDLGEQQAIVLNVLEHLDRQHTIEFSCQHVLRHLEVDDVAGQARQIVQSAFIGARHDVVALAMRSEEHTSALQSLMRNSY